MALRISQCILLAASVLPLSGCSMLQEAIHSRPVIRAQSASIQPVSWESNSIKSIFVVGHGWHTGIVLRVADITPEVWPEIEEFRQFRYVEIGWGDEGFYRMDGLKMGTAMKAAFLPTPSVMHVAAFDLSPDLVFDHSDVIALELEADEFESLTKFIAATCRRGADGEAKDLGEGRYGYSRFYRGAKSYYLPQTCNVWTAQALQQAGQPISPSLCVTAEAVIRRMHECGETLNHSDAGLKRSMLRAERPEVE
ncbi:MAG: DUF2459 domain-containing protein [Planctomycetaceae bacterium]|nr:DUF2459 domain-containing protein [Planctomycetaceae bacterium]